MNDQPKGVQMDDDEKEIIILTPENERLYGAFMHEDEFNEHISKAEKESRRQTINDLLGKVKEETDFRMDELKEANGSAYIRIGYSQATKDVISTLEKALEGKE